MEETATKGPSDSTWRSGGFRWYYLNMNYPQFLEICQDKPVRLDPDLLPDESLLLSLWHDRRGHWDTAHRIAQSIHTSQGSALHAYLHREEGDLSNAQYWYNRAERPMPKSTLEEEWEALAKEFCELT